MSSLHANRRFRRRKVLWTSICVVLLTVAGAIWWSNRSTPARLLERGLLASRTDRAEAERLFREAIHLGGGRYPDAQVGLCILLSRRGAWAEALREFTATEKSASRPDLLLDFGERAYDAGYREEGIEAWKEVRTRGGAESVQALELIAADAADWEMHEDLIEATRELTRLQPGQPSRWRALIDLLRSMHRDVECITAIEAALAEKLPEEFHDDLRHQLVDRLIVSGDVTRAREEIDRLEQDEGDSLRLRVDKIDLYRLEGELDSALELLTEIFPQIKDRPDAYFVRGTLYLDLGRYVDAIPDLKKVIENNPAHDKAHFKLAQAYQASGRPEDAQRERQIVDRLAKKRLRISELLNELIDAPHDREICAELAKLHRELGERELAIRWEHRAAARSRNYQKKSGE